MNVNKTNKVSIATGWVIYVTAAALAVRYFRIDIKELQTIASIALIISSIFLYITAPVMIMVAVVCLLMVFTNKVDNMLTSAVSQQKKVPLAITITNWIFEIAALYFSYATHTIYIFVPVLIIVLCALLTVIYKKEMMSKIAKMMLIGKSDAEEQF
jgi:hypothetical protein